MKRPPLAACAALALAACSPDHGLGPLTFMRGADVSFLDEYQQRGVSFSDGGAPGDALKILASHGMNVVRLRLWNDPTAGFCNLERTLAVARQARRDGLHLLLDLHYSDTWADPGHQITPAAWAGLGLTDLASAVKEFTAEVVGALRAQGTLPDVVQLGNEITSGMLWDTGRVGGAFDTPAQWDALAALLNAAHQGVLEALAPGDEVRVMLHIDRGGDNAGARYFLDHVVARGVTFDLIGLSYYPWWHGSFADLAANLADLAPRYGKDLVVVETSYPWTMTDFGGGENFVSSASQLVPGYPATPAGQLAYFTDLFALVRASPATIGLFWWAPEFVYTSPFSQEDPSDNLTLFDDAHAALPAVAAFNSTE